MASRRDPQINIRANDKTKRAFRAVKDRLRGLKSNVLNAKSALFALAGVGGFGLLIKQSFASADALAKTADKLGTTTEAMAGLQLAGQITGVKINTMNMAMQRLTRRASEAAAGTGEAKDAIKELGIDALHLAAVPLDQKMAIIADAMAKVKTQSDRVRLSFKLFDSEGVAIVNTLALGSKGLEEMQQKALALGIAMSRIDAAKIEAANDSFTEMKAAISGVANRIAVKLAPWLQAISDSLVESSIQSQGFKTEIADAMDIAVQAVGLFFDAIRGLEFAWLAVKLAFSSAAEFITTGLLDIDRVLVDTLNKLPLLTLEYSATLDAIAASQSATTDRIAAEMEALVLTPLPSEGVDAFFKSVEAKAIASAQLIADRQAEIAEASRIAGLEAVEAHRLIETEKLYAFEDARMASVRRFGDRELAFSTWTAKKKTKTVIDQAIELTRGVSFQSKKLFAINKVAAIANAIMNTWEGVTKTMSAYPYPINLAMAGLSLAAGLAQVQQIQSASFSGGAGGGGIGGIGGTPTPPSDFATPTTDLISGPTEIKITVDGTGVLTRDQAEGIAESLRDLVTNGGGVLA